MAEVILFPDTEDAVRLYLAASFAARTGFTAVQVFTGKTPATLPSEFVFVRRTGGPRRDLVVDQPQITIEAYGKLGSRAERIANLARGLLHAAAADGQMGSVVLYEAEEIVGPYLDPDPNRPDHTRYSATFSLAVRGFAA